MQWNNMMYNNVNISKADNGYVVSCYGNDGEEKSIAKTIDEAMAEAKKMLAKEYKKENYKDVKTRTVRMAMKK